MSALTLARDLQPGDRIVCPGDGRRERVVFNRVHDKGRFIRTDRHDHLSPNDRVFVHVRRPPEEPVEGRLA